MLIGKDNILFDENDECMKLIYREIQKNIQDALFRKKIDYCTLSELTGCNKSYLYKIINYETKPGLSILLKICLVLDMTIDELIPEIDKKDSQRIHLEKMLSQLEPTEAEMMVEMITAWVKSKHNNKDWEGK